MLAMALLVAALLLVPTLSAGYRPVLDVSDQVSSKSVMVLVPAVGELTDGSLIGVTMSLEATIRSGTGGVFVDTRPLTQVDMQGSARLAAATAAAIAGARADEYDFFITIRSDTTVVGGPSAGAAITSAFVALLLDLPLRDDVVMTGMINPDGSVGPVGGILQKAQAAHEAGASLFLIPLGQGVVESIQQTVDDSGWFPTTRNEIVRTDVRQHAKDNWGLDVKELTDIYDAIEYATDYRLSRPDVPEVGVSELFQQVMGEAAQNQLNDAEARYRVARSALDDGTLAIESKTTYDRLDVLLQTARAKLGLAAESAAEGSPYTASSQAFQAGLEIREVEIWLDVLAAPDARQAVTEYGEALKLRLDATRAKAAVGNPRHVSVLEAVGAAQVRVQEAGRLLAAAEALHADDRTAEAVDALAFAEERRRSVEWWMGLADSLAAQIEGASFGTDVPTLATELRGIAQEAIAYAEVLVRETGASQDQAGLLRQASQKLVDSRAAAQDGLAVGSMYLAIEARVGAHAALSLVGSADLIDARLQRQRDLALIAVDNARGAGAEPFLAVSLVDFAATLAPTQPVDALVMYGNAAAIAATSAALASGDDCGYAGVPCRSSAPSVHRIRIPGPDPWTAYFALATVLLGFMAGILVALVSMRQKALAHAAPGAAIAPASAPTRRPGARPRQMGRTYNAGATRVALGPRPIPHRRRT